MLHIWPRVADDVSNCGLAVADPGIPVGGRRPRGGGANSRGSYVSKSLYVKTKESGPLGGAAGAPLDPPMLGGKSKLLISILVLAATITVPYLGPAHNQFWNHCYSCFRFRTVLGFHGLQLLKT